MTRPEVSVVMGVFNNADSLRATLDSVLSQDGLAIELVVIDDGSTDGSAEILRNYAARDHRLKLVRQQNAGLTLALIRGCEIAQGEFIARQDAGGDLSLPDRFAHQVTFLRSRPQAVMTACGTRVVGPAGEPLCNIRHHGCELHDRLRATSLDAIHGPSHHGAVMFRRNAYEGVGGYRAAFRVAQDLDLWTRLAEFGPCLATPEIFYEARLSKRSISQLNRHQQMRATQAILQCAAARRQGRDDAAILMDLHSPPISPEGFLAGRARDASFYYFVGSLLRRRRPYRARMYFTQALCSWPLHSRAWLGLLQSFLAPRSR